MIEEQGRVVAVEDGAAWVETIRKSTCASCSAKNGCGQHLSERYRSSKSHSYIKAISDRPLSVDDKVVIGIPEQALMKASMLVYLLPLVIMMASLWLASWLGLNDLAAILMSVTGLCLGFLPVRALGQRAGDMCRIRVVKILPRVEVEPELLPLRNSWSA